MTESQTIDKPKLTAEIVSATFQLELSKLKYQEALAGLVAYQVTRENIPQAQEKLKEARKMLTKFDEIKKNGKAAALAECRWWDEAYNGTKEAFDSELAIKAGQVNKISNEVAEEARKAESEKQLKAQKLSEIDNFFIAQSQAVANATTPEEIVRVEKLIGSHRRAARYDGFYDVMDAKAANLTDLIKQQKVALKELEGLKTAENAANEIGDDQAVLDSREAQEQITAKISENREVVQGTAINMATNSTITEVEVIAPVAPKPRRQSWKWRVCNLQTTAKKMPHWVVLAINELLVEEYLKAKKAEGIDGELFEFAGIEFYLEKTY